ncbi:MAG: glycosyltransferase family 2 protein, partial [Ruminococcus sp.]|nr:glycosyltransferase family 2 protein [Ruminococcus sp.]
MLEQIGVCQGIRRENMFTVSVIITFYNQEKYVDATMQSVLDQKTDFDFEIIAGDDGSSDRTVELVQKWAERFPGRIRTFVRSREDGVTVAGFRASRNRLSLLEHVRGKYFIFLDGDDYFSDDRKLQK